jgi:hypothetical protein
MSLCSQIYCNVVMDEHELKPLQSAYLSNNFRLCKD